MNIPYIIQYILSLHRPDYSPISYLGGAQVVVPAFPAGQTVTVSIGPAPDFAHIIWNGNFGPRIIPDAFYAVGIQAGASATTGVVTDWFTLNTDFSGFIIQTQNNATFTTLTNRSAFNQYFESFLTFIRISTHDDYVTIMKALDRLGTSLASETAVVEAATLLGQMKLAYDKELEANK